MAAADVESGIVQNIADINLDAFDFDQACDEEAAHEEPGIISKE